jgi:hypothetical protein
VLRQSVIMRLLLLAYRVPCLSTGSIDSDRALFFPLKISKARFGDEGMGGCGR